MKVDDLIITDWASGRQTRDLPVRPLRVMRIIARLNIGGPARHAIVLGNDTTRHGFESLLVYGSVQREEGSLEHLIPQSGLFAVRVPELGRRIRFWSDVSAFYRILRLMFLGRPDVVHTHTAKGGALGRTAALLYNLTRSRAERCAVIHTFHGHVFAGYFGAIASTAVRTIERTLAHATDRVVAISESQKRDLCSKYRIASALKTEVVELGLELDPLRGVWNDTSLRDELGISPQEVVFGFVGRFVPIKDLTTLIKAFAHASRQLPAHLLMVGDGELRPVLERLVADLGVANVRFLGWRHDLIAVYGALDVAVLSSQNEGTPVALIEAMAAGKPVVATRVGGVEDVVTDGRTGLLVSAGDIRGFAEALVQLAGDRDLRHRMGNEARREMAHRFSPDRLRERIGSVYRRAVSQRRGARAEG
jgi:glycosyltransferase involved in cell wall biosynthesis